MFVYHSLCTGVRSDATLQWENSRQWGIGYVLPEFALELGAEIVYVGLRIIIWTYVGMYMMKQ